jgi:hypothetical protein
MKLHQCMETRDGEPLVGVPSRPKPCVLGELLALIDGVADGEWSRAGKSVTE